MFHIPIQTALALVGLHQFRRHRYFLTLTAGSILASIALFDFTIGVLTDFRHLPISEELAFTNYLTEMLKAYLFINILYSQTADPTGFSLLREGVAPLLAVAAVNAAQNTGDTIHALRPFLIGIVPNVVAAIRGTTRLNPNLILWFRLALPLYSMRYLIASQRVWELIFGWFLYNSVFLGTYTLYY